MVPVVPWINGTKIRQTRPPLLYVVLTMTWTTSFAACSMLIMASGYVLAVIPFLVKQVAEWIAGPSPSSVSICIDFLDRIVSATWPLHSPRIKMIICNFHSHWRSSGPSLITHLAIAIAIARCLESDSHHNRETSWLTFTFVAHFTDTDLDLVERCMHFKQNLLEMHETIW